jgi:hypothetical protein
MSVNALNAYTQVHAQDATTNSNTNTQSNPAGSNNQTADPQDTVSISDTARAAQQSNHIDGTNGGSK